MELAKLAVWHSCQCPDVATHLIGMQNLHDLDINLNVVYNGLSNKERELLNEIKQK